MRGSIDWLLLWLIVDGVVSVDELDVLIRSEQSVAGWSLQVYRAAYPPR